MGMFTEWFFREKETQEQTQVKTLDLLTMDMNKNSKEEKQSEKAMEKGALENSTALYGELHCRGSIENEVDFLARLHKVHRAIAVTVVIHVPVRVRVTLALKFSRSPYLENHSSESSHTCTIDTL